jgi:hypothetical protein
MVLTVKYVDELFCAVPDYGKAVFDKQEAPASTNRRGAKIPV